MQPSIQVLDARAEGLPCVGAKLELLATGATWGEGPVWMHEDESVLWSDIPGNRMLRWHPSEGFRVWRDYIGFVNGHAREADGSLVHCSHGQRAIIRTRMCNGKAVGQDEIVVSHYQGRRLNSPNDVAVKSDGSIWFTDPPYGILSDHEGYKAERELPAHYVFRFDPAIGSLDIASDLIEEPNGLAFSPNENVLYVTDTSAALRRDGGGNHHIVAFDMLGERTLTNPRVFAVIRPGLADGIRIDASGWLYSSSADGVHVYHPDGTRIAHIPTPEKVGNLTFGGVARDELYIAASTSLYRIRLNAQGIQKP